MGGCLSYRLKLVRECDEFPKSQTLFRKVTRFSFKSLEKATNNFEPSGEIRKNGVSKSYNGILDDGSQVVVIVYSSTDKVFSEFASVISIMSGVKHNNVVELIGYCIEGDHRILVHKFVGESSLDQMLFSEDVVLDWPTRVSVCHGIACGLDYLHNGVSPRVLHCDIKPSNIFMDSSFNPKIGDFAFSCLLNEDESHYTCNEGVFGTLGFIDPELFHTGIYSEKTDVYAFGITLLEIVNGNRNVLFRRDPELTTLEDWAWKLRTSGRISEMVDQKLSEFSEDTVTRLVIIALSCVQFPSDRRPSMSEVRLMLSDSFDYSKIVLPLYKMPLQVNFPLQPMSSDSELSVNLSDDEDTFFVL